jgi:hypothetical protein
MSFALNEACNNTWHKLSAGLLYQSKTYASPIVFVSPSFEHTLKRLRKDWYQAEPELHFVSQHLLFEWSFAPTSLGDVPVRLDL